MSKPVKKVKKNNNYKKNKHCPHCIINNCPKSDIINQSNEDCLYFIAHTKNKIKIRSWLKHNFRQCSGCNHKHPMVNLFELFESLLDRNLIKQLFQKISSYILFDLKQKYFIEYFVHINDDYEKMYDKYGDTWGDWNCSTCHALEWIMTSSLKIQIFPYEILYEKDNIEKTHTGFITLFKEDRKNEISKIIFWDFDICTPWTEKQYKKLAEELKITDLKNKAFIINYEQNYHQQCLPWTLINLLMICKGIKRKGVEWVNDKDINGAIEKFHRYYFKREQW